MNKLFQGINWKKVNSLFYENLFFLKFHFLP